MNHYDNKRSEQNDAERMVIREAREANGDPTPIAKRIAANIESVVADGDAHLEPYFVY